MDSPDVFLSHHSQDKDLVEPLAWALRQAGLQPWFDKWELKPGGRWRDDIAAALRESRAIAICYGPSGMGGVHGEEMQVALEFARKYDKPTYAVFFRGAHRDDVDPWVATRTRVDLDRDDVDLSDAAVIRALFGIDAPRSKPLDLGACPFRGLEPFLEEHARWFFGRDDARRRLLAALADDRRLITVVGASGSGKSSLVRAGLVPALRGGEWHGQRDWRIAVLTPTAHPLHMLATAVVALLHGDAADAGERKLRLEQALAREPSALNDEVALALARVEQRPSADGKPHSETRVLIVVDQFEEAFTLAAREEAWPFIDALLHAVESPSGRVHAVLTLRADFFGEALRHDGLSKRLKATLEPISGLSPGELRAAITEPAERVGLAVDGGLVTALVDAVAGEPGNLPLLQFALDKLWHERKHDESRLPVAAYDREGGLKGMLVSHADQVIGDLGSDQAVLARSIFLGMVQVGVETNTRRRLRGDELEAIDRKGAVAVIDRLIESRLVTAQGDDEGGISYELAHETLIREWPTLKRWIAEDREAIQLRQNLEREASRRNRAEAIKGDDRLCDTKQLNQATQSLDGIAPRDSGVSALGSIELGAARAKERAIREAARADLERVQADRLELPVIVAAWQLLLATPHSSEWLSVATRFIERREALEDKVAEYRNRLFINKDNDDVRRAWLDEFDAFVSKTRVIDETAVATVEGSVYTIENAAAWQQAIEAIRTDSRYGGLTISPQFGLLPLGRNDKTGLFEFWHVLSGQRPTWTAESVETKPEMAVVLVLIPGGEFLMGAQKDDPRAPGYDKLTAGTEGPPRIVAVPAFLMSEYAMTQAQWQRLAGANPSYFNGDLHPVDSVNWHESSEVTRSVGLRLPSEAEWEYAARAGTTGPWSCGDNDSAHRPLAGWLRRLAGRTGSVGDESAFMRCAWYATNSGNTSHPVGELEANGFGLYDVHGNVNEWCEDAGLAYDPARTDAEPVQPAGDGPGAVQRVIRGGYFGLGASLCRSAGRDAYQSSGSDIDLGLRPARSLL